MDLRTKIILYGAACSVSEFDDDMILEKNKKARGDLFRSIECDIEKFENMIRDLCIGHKDDCICVACLEVFRRKITDGNTP